MMNMNESRMKIKLTIGLLMLVFFCPLALIAQDRIVSGTVSDAQGEPIIGANVRVVGTSSGAATNIDGYYTLSVPSSATRLHVSYIGMKDIEVNITGNVVNIVMDEDVSSLDELVVIGYGTQRRRDLT